MSYHVWTVNGLGFCVDNIKTTPERILQLAALNEETLFDVEEYLNNCFDGEYKCEDLTVNDFDDFEGVYGDRGLSTILYEVISEEIPIGFADDFNGFGYILYCPSYPWNLNDKERDLTAEKIKEILSKYIKILTDDPVTIDFYSVENGG